MVGKILAEIQQSLPIGGMEAEAFRKLQRTADRLMAGVAQVLKPADLSPAQYNVLRILRGAGGDGLACREIADRMLTHDPDITRLLDRLEDRGLVTRCREKKDRRVITVRLTKPGLRTLKDLDGPVEELHRRQLGHLGPRRLRDLMEALELAWQNAG
jgi:DNA-binding MarR family transcriptional regulator